MGKNRKPMLILLSAFHSMSFPLRHESQGFQFYSLLLPHPLSAFHWSLCGVWNQGVDHSKRSSSSPCLAPTSLTENEIGTGGLFGITVGTDPSGSQMFGFRGSSRGRGRSRLPMEQGKTVYGRVFMEGEQELSAARQWLQEDEMRRAAEERRREKAEELAARQRVREKIERDKAERAKKYGGNVGSRPSPPTEPGPVPSSPSQEPPSKREYDQSRIQVRLPDGTSLTQMFRAWEQLAAVRLYVELHRGEEPGGDQDPVQLLSGFSRRAFSEADMERPLQELGLVPSAVLIVAKKCPS
ncbi:unnamed protein product [Nyctereutes procyonoides]|uniref:(raccoon dog) hypothetical protein n=2 Tax=Nyctereutes procyonoides TaxID=34880 RepID=A0A811ZBX5_NYCPR|nr:unnamed protein product [Nyctereutes procyonoides]